MQARRVLLVAAVLAVMVMLAMAVDAAKVVSQGKPKRATRTLQGIQLQNAFDGWMNQPGNPQYSQWSDEFYTRMTTFGVHSDLVTSYNNNGNSYSLALNEYSAMTTGEFNSQKIGFASNKCTLNMSTVQGPGTSRGGLAYTVNSEWAIRTVQDQGTCQACWAFACVTVLEGFARMRWGTQLDLSVQQVIDCGSSTGNLGCSIGSITNCFDYYNQNSAISDSAYKGGQGYQSATGSCGYSAGDSGFNNFVGNLNHYTCPAGDEICVMQLLNNGTVAAGIDASSASFHHYSTGIMDSDTTPSGSCNPNQPNHAVVILGYNENGNDHWWFVRNSWGTSWGAAGNLNVRRFFPNLCGIATEASQPYM